LECGEEGNLDHSLCSVLLSPLVLLTLIAGLTGRLEAFLIFIGLASME